MPVIAWFLLVTTLGTGTAWWMDSSHLKKEVKTKAVELQQLNEAEKKTASDLETTRRATRELELRYTSEHGQFKQGVAYDFSRSWQQAADIQVQWPTSMSNQHQSDLKRYVDLYGFNAQAAANAWSEAALKAREQQVNSLELRIKQLEQELSTAAIKSTDLEFKLRTEQTQSGVKIVELKDRVSERTSMVERLKQIVYGCAAVIAGAFLAYLLGLWLLGRLKLAKARAEAEAAKLKQTIRQSLLTGPEGNDQTVNSLHATGLLTSVFSDGHLHLLDKVQMPGGQSLASWLATPSESQKSAA